MTPDDAAGAAVRGRRVRPRRRDRGARARARPRAHARRDGPLRRAAPARLGPPRAAVARAQRRPRRLLCAIWATPRATSTTGRSRRFVRCAAGTARWSRRARRSPGRCSWCVSVTSPTRRPHRAARRRAAPRILSIGIASSRRASTFAYLRDREPRADHAAAGRRYDSDLAVLGDHVRDPAVIYRPIEQLLSRTIADRRARGLARPPAADAGVDPGQLRAAVPARRAGAATADRARRLRRLGALYWILVSACSPTPRATSRAAGSPDTSGSRSTAGSCSSSRPRGFLFALAVAVGIALGPGGGRARHGGRAVRRRCA